MQSNDSFCPYSLHSNGKRYRKDQSTKYKFSMGLCLWPPHGFLPPSLASLVHSLSLLPPAIPSPLSAAPFPLFNAPHHILAGLLLHLRLSPSLPRPLAAWLPLCLLLPLAAVDINPIQFRDISIPLSHDCVPVLVNIMAFDCSKSTVLSLMPLGPGFLESLQYILLSVLGIEEGSLQGLPWQALPLIRSVVKERLALAAFTPCPCKFILLT